MTPIPAKTCELGPTTIPTSLIRRSLDFANQGGFARAVEMCSGVGACRKTASGTMCPSYMVTRDEIHSTRGRANLLRLAMTGELSGDDDGLDNETLHEALDLCLQCKACKSECPSQVDMAKLKAEVLYQHYQNRARPLSHLLLGQIFRLNPIAAATAPLTNLGPGQPRCSNGFWKRPPASTAGERSHIRRTPFPQVVSRSSGRFTRRRARVASCCSMIVSPPTTTRTWASRRCECWKPQAIGSNWRAWRAADGPPFPRGCFRWPASSPLPMFKSSHPTLARAFRSLVASRAAWSRCSTNTANSVSGPTPRPLRRQRR